MVLKYWTKTDQERLLHDQKEYKLPQKVVTVIANTLGILDRNYGAERSIEEDGGYLAIITGTEDDKQKEYQQLLNQHHIKREETEFEDVVCEGEDGNLWRAELYIVSSDYGVTILYEKN